MLAIRLERRLQAASWGAVCMTDVITNPTRSQVTYDEFVLCDVLERRAINFIPETRKRGCFYKLLQLYDFISGLRDGFIATLSCCNISFSLFYVSEE